MEAVLALELPAVETRERLLGFVEEVVSELPHVRQRENAGLYVRGLIEQGGRKSLQPTLFRLEETLGAVRVGAAVSGGFAVGSGAGGAAVR